ncbi:hypothetical protein [Methanobrevibacter sp.]|uniref:hypothetical protein n=1 Tax=Methanobrevibacter sp. TaxID=66852 RepID=UPI002E78977B|nr:hypothetical protein [Methanobrevibacter sp.]MEE1334937.1 hypothetical protein [Methanobrevibacter sp.]
MRQRKNNKIVLRSGNGRQNAPKRKFGRNKDKFVNRPSRPRNPRNRKPKKQRKSSGALMVVVIIALIAFVIGAGIGVSLSFNDGNDNQPHFENVTEEMTNNVNGTEVVFDKEVDGVDYNENGSSSQLNAKYLKANED